MIIFAVFFLTRFYAENKEKILIRNQISFVIYRDLIKKVLDVFAVTHVNST